MNMSKKKHDELLKKHDELLNKWLKDKFWHDNNYVEKDIVNERPIFVKDGIVNPAVWTSLNENMQPKILYIMRESYGWQDIDKDVGKSKIDAYKKLGIPRWDEKNNCPSASIDLAKILANLEEAYKIDTQHPEYIKPNGKEHYGGVWPSKTWGKIVEWTLGLTETKANSLPAYKTIGASKNEDDSFCGDKKPGPNLKEVQEVLSKISFVNLKKGSGNSLSGGVNFAEELAVVCNEKDEKDSKTTNCKYLKDQIEIINPDVIVCGGTFVELRKKDNREVLFGDKAPQQKKCIEQIDKDGWTTIPRESKDSSKRSNASDEVIVLSVSHPSSGNPKVSYYGICGLYQQALMHLEK